MSRRADKTTLLGIPGGAGGTHATLRLMRKMINKAKKNFIFRRLALQIVRNVAPKDWAGEASAVQSWVRRNIRYVRDINGVETLHSPEKILELGQGDCDDQAMLVSVLLESIGFSTRLHAVGFQKNRYAHVFTEAKITLRNGGSRWMAVETTENWPLGKTPQNAVSHMMVNV